MKFLLMAGQPMAPKKIPPPRKKVLIRSYCIHLLVVEPTHLKNMRMKKLDHFSKGRGEHEKYLKTPPSSPLVSLNKGLIKP